MNHIEYNDILIKLPELRVYFKKVERHLTFAELRLLLIFLSEPEQTIESGELIRRARLTTRSALARYVNSLRNILDQKYIYNQRNSGYSFEPPQRSLNG